MKVYKTVFTNRWEIWEKDTDELKIIGSSDTVTDYKPGVGHFGNCYDNRFYRTEAAARAYINREPVDPADEIRIER